MGSARLAHDENARRHGLCEAAALPIGREMSDELIDTIQSLQALRHMQNVTIGNLQVGKQQYEDAWRAACADRDVCKRERDKLKVALRDYGRHLYYCRKLRDRDPDSDTPCTCGWSMVSSLAADPEEGE